MNEEQIFAAIRLAAARKEKRLDLSFADVSFLSSAMINSLVRGSKLANSLGVEMRIVHASPNVVEVLKIARLNRLFQIDDQ